METMVSVAPSGRVKRIFLLLPNPQGVALGYPVRPLQGGMKVSGQALSDVELAGRVPGCADGTSSVPSFLWRIRDR